MKKLKNESGRTMVEMLGVLAIMGVIMYGAITGIGFGVDMYKVTTAYNDVEELAQSVIDMWSWSKGYPSGDLGPTLCAQNATPGECSEETKDSTGVVTKASQPLGVWSNEIDVRGRSNSDGESTFTIAMRVPSRFICNRLKNLDYHNVCVVDGQGDCKTNCDDNTLCFVQSEVDGLHSFKCQN